MKIDLHCHSKLSYDNFLEPRVIIEQAAILGLDGVCFTEHHTVETSAAVADLKTPDGFVVLRGVEIGTDRGHLLAFGPEDDGWNRWVDNSHPALPEVVATIHALGGVCFAAHPYRGWDSLGDLALSSGLDGLETHNGQNDPAANSAATEAASRVGLASIGGSDCHGAGQIGAAHTIFEREVRTLEALVTEIKAGRCRGAMRAR